VVYEDNLSTLKQLPLLNDYSQFEYAKECASKWYHPFLSLSPSLFLCALLLNCESLTYHVEAYEYKFSLLHKPQTPKEEDFVDEGIAHVRRPGKRE
jgi:hypothetical protein